MTSYSFHGLPSLESTYFDACAHGSLRDKRTKLLATQGVFTSLAADCPPKPCACIMATLQERSGCHISLQQQRQNIQAPYASAWPIACLRHQLTLGVRPTPSLKLEDFLRLGLGQQSIRHPPLVPEYKEFYTSMTFPIIQPTNYLLLHQIMGK